MQKTTRVKVSEVKIGNWVLFETDGPARWAKVKEVAIVVPGGRTPGKPEVMALRTHNESWLHFPHDMVSVTVESNG